MTPHPCVACGAEDWAAIERGLVRCGRCGFVRAADLPTPEAIATLYGPGYFLGEEYADYLADAPAHAENFRRRAGRIAEIAGPLRSLFEIGCAHGLWLEAVRARGVRAAGIDVAPDAVRHAVEVLKLDAVAGRFEDLEIEPGTYQAYCMWDTIEHLANPERHAGKIARLLPAGGWFFFTTGDIGSPLARRQGPRWRMIHPPTHLQYFSRETASRFLSRQGLAVKHVESVPMCRSVFAAVEGLRRFGSGAARLAAEAASRVVPSVITRRVRFTVDLGDIMLVCARKE